MSPAGTVSGIREWFRWYKTPDGKPINAFGHGEKALSAKEAIHVCSTSNEPLASLAQLRPVVSYHPHCARTASPGYLLAKRPRSLRRPTASTRSSWRARPTPASFGSSRRHEYAMDVRARAPALPRPEASRKESTPRLSILSKCVRLST
eukprot:scaffold32182_cov26-Tisochrysis_lutea.AAC.1